MFEIADNKDMKEMKNRKVAFYIKTDDSGNAHVMAKIEGGNRNRDTHILKLSFDGSNLDMYYDSTEGKKLIELEYFPETLISIERWVERAEEDDEDEDDSDDEKCNHCGKVHR